MIVSRCSLGPQEQDQARPGGSVAHGTARTGPYPPSVGLGARWRVRCSYPTALKVWLAPATPASAPCGSYVGGISLGTRFKQKHSPTNNQFWHNRSFTSRLIAAAAVASSSGLPDADGSTRADRSTTELFPPGTAPGSSKSDSSSKADADDSSYSSGTTPRGADSYGHGTAGSRSAGPGRPTTLRAAWKAWISLIKQILQYRLMVLLRLPTWGKVLALVVVGLPTILVGSSLLRAFAGMTWHESVQYAFYVLQNVPGADVTGFPEIRARLVLILIHLISLYTFATLVGLLTDDVRRTVDEITSGNFPIPTRGHTVILDACGDSPRLVNAIQQILATRGARGGDVYSGGIAVLSPEPKEELDRLVEEAVQKETASVVTRHGCPLKVADLQRVAAAHARTVLLLAPSGPMGPYIDPGLQQQLCLTALRSMHTQPREPAIAAPLPLRAAADISGPTAGWLSALEGAMVAAVGAGGVGERCRQRVIVESSCSSGTRSALQLSEALGDEEDPLQVTYVSSASSAARVAVQCAAQPGLAAVFDQVFCRSGGASLLIVPLPPQLQDRPFSEARLWFRRAVVCGLLPAVDGHDGAESGSAAAAGTTHCVLGSTDTGTSVGVGITDSAPIRSAGGNGGGRNICFCPPDVLKLRRGDSLVLLAKAILEDGRPEAAPAVPPPLPPLTARYDGRRSMLRRLVLIALDSELSGAMLSALDEFAAPGCRVTMVSPEPCRGLPPGPTPRAGLRLRNEVGSPTDCGVLVRADAVAADAVILTGTDGMPPVEADALALSTAMLLQRLLANTYSTVAEAPAAATVAEAAAADGAVSPGPWASYDAFPWSSQDAGDAYHGDFYRGLETVGASEQGEAGGRRAELAQEGGPGDRPLPPRPLTFVCSLTDPQNRSVLEHVADSSCRTAKRAARGDGGPAARGLSVEVVEPKSLVSGILAQVGAEPLLVGALEDLLDEQGCEVYIKRTDRYGLARLTRITWAQVSEVVRRDGDVALGYLRRAPGEGLLLAPPADWEVAPIPGDKLVVLSESFL